jgi:hypothetical protein
MASGCRTPVSRLAASRTAARMRANVRPVVSCAAALGTQSARPTGLSLKDNPRPGWTGGLYDFVRRVITSVHGHQLYRQRQQTIEPVFGHTKHNRGFRQ